MSVKVSRQINYRAFNGAVILAQKLCRYGTSNLSSLPYRQLSYTYQNKYVDLISPRRFGVVMTAKSARRMEFPH